MCLFSILCSAKPHDGKKDDKRNEDANNQLPPISCHHAFKASCNQEVPVQSANCRWPLPPWRPSTCPGGGAGGRGHAERTASSYYARPLEPGGGVTAARGGASLVPFCQNT